MKLNSIASSLFFCEPSETIFDFIAAFDRKKLPEHLASSFLICLESSASAVAGACAIAQVAITSMKRTVVVILNKFNPELHPEDYGVKIKNLTTWFGS
jgi:hypothetical protein